MRAGLLGVLVSLDGVDPHFLGRQAQCPDERPARLLAVHVQLCSLSLGKPHAPGLGLVLDANLVNGVDLPSVLERYSPEFVKAAFKAAYAHRFRFETFLGAFKYGWN